MENKIEEVVVFSSDNDITIMQVCAILEDNKIEYIKIEEGINAFMKIYAGLSLGKKKIIVSNQDYEKAIDLIKGITGENSNLVENEIPDELREAEGK